MKKLAYFFVGLIVASLFISSAHAQTIYPNRGGTGTTTTPSLGQVLVGQANGTYAPQATSTLGFLSGLIDLASQVLGILGIANGGTNASSQTTNGVTYYDGTQITSASSLTWNGSTLGVSRSAGGQIATFLSSGITSGQNNFLLIGKADSSQNAIAMGYNIAASGVGHLFIKPRSATMGIGLNILDSNGTGYVGIGTTSPLVDLEIANSATSTLRLSSSDTTLAAGQGTGQVDFYASDASGGGLGVMSRILSYTSGTASEFGNLGFFTGTNAASLVQNGTLNYLGNLGIGTTSPFAKLSIFSSGGSSIPLFSVSSSTSGVGTTTALHVAPNGFVGIGTSTPSNPLHVTGSLGSFVVENTGDAVNFTKSGNNFIKANNASGILNFQTGGNNTRMTILSTGATGIGTTTPTSLFQTFSTGTSTISIDSNSATRGGCIEMKDTDGVGYTYLYANNGILSASSTSCK